MITLFCHGLVVSLAVGCALLFAWIDQPLERNLWLSRASGYTALGLLLASQAISPLRRLIRGSALLGRMGLRFNEARLLAWRRSLGMAAAEAALLHFGLSVYFQLDGQWRVWQQNYLRAGLAALIILVCLWITSFPVVLRLLRLKVWTPLHRLVYAAVCLALIHAALAPFSSLRVVALLAGLAVVMFWLRLMPIKSKNTPRKIRAPQAAETQPVVAESSQA